MPNVEKLEMLKVVRKYILNHPRVTFAELVAELKLPRLSTVQFYNLKAQLRKKGLLVDKGESKSTSRARSNDIVSASKAMRIEILESVDVSNFSEEIKAHYKTDILGLLNRLVPNGKNLTMVFLSDPPTLEIRRIVS
jgi:hypothetical protein